LEYLLYEMIIQGLKIRYILKILLFPFLDMFLASDCLKLLHLACYIEFKTITFGML